MKKITVLTLTLLFSIFSFAQKVSAYKIYNSKGKEVSAKKMLKDMEEVDVVLFGEYHNNPISHYFEFEVTSYLADKHDIVLGAEMFEADNQQYFNRYLKNEINREELDSLVRLWPNYDTDYSQLVEFAKENQIDFIATNIPRRSAKLVHQGGFEALDSLTDLEKSWIAPLPIDFDPELPGYKSMMTMMMGQTSVNLPKAQAMKDATMAHFIVHNIKNDHIFIHFNGSFHSNNYEGIYWYIQKKNPDLTIKTITTVTQSDVNKLEKDNKGIADYIICVDENVTNSY